MAKMHHGVMKSLYFKPGWITIPPLPMCTLEAVEDHSAATPAQLKSVQFYSFSFHIQN